MLRLLLTVLVAYFVLLLLQKTICFGINTAIMDGYWWMCGDEPAKQVAAAPQSPLSISIGSAVSLWQGLVKSYEYYPPAAAHLAPDQAQYIYAHWCWQGLLP